MTAWEARQKGKIVALRLAVALARIPSGFALLFWWKHKRKPLEFLLGLQPRAGLALHYAQDSLRRGEPLFKPGQALRVLRPIEAQMWVVPKFQSTVTVRLQPGEHVSCAGRTPGSLIDLVYAGDATEFIKRTVDPKDHGTALHEWGKHSSVRFFVSSSSSLKLEECLEAKA
jgi:hypothetical protein